MLRMPAVLSLSLALSLALLSSFKKDEEKKADPAGSGTTAEKGGEIGKTMGGGGQPMQQPTGQRRGAQASTNPE